MKQRSYGLRKKNEMYKKKNDVSFFSDEDSLSAYVERQELLKKTFFFTNERFYNNKYFFYLTILKCSNSNNCICYDLCHKGVR